QCSRFRLTITDDGGNNLVWIVKCRSVSVRQGISEFATLMNGAGSLRRYVTGNSSGKRKLLKEPLHTLFICRDVRVNLTIGSFQVGISDESRPAVTWPRDVNHVEIVLLDKPVQVNVNEVQTRRRSPVSKQPRFHMLFGERFLQQRMVIEINLANGQVVRGTPVGVYSFQLGFGEHVLQRIRGSIRLF